MSHHITVDHFVRWLGDSEELAVFDLRSTADDGGGPFFGTPVTPAELDARAPLLLPRRSVRVVLVDETGNAAAALAAARLQAQGWHGVRVLAGGLQAWRSSGRSAALHPRASVSSHKSAAAGPPGWPGGDVLQQVLRPQLAEWLKDRLRTTYLLDLRDAGVRAQAPVRAALPAPAELFLLNEHEVLAVRGARLVLVDGPDGIRARSTARGLQPRGWEVHWLATSAARAVRTPTPSEALV